jgi:hypothetical protein
MTLGRDWKRLFPVRFRHLSGDSSFSRWDIVRFQYRRPTKDSREESCHVYEESIAVDGKLPPREHSNLLAPTIVGSAEAATKLGHSLALIRPRNTRFVHKLKTEKQVQEEREAYKAAARQTSFFDKELAELEPSAYEFRFRFDDDAGKHDYESGDWETHVTFWRWRERYGEEETLKRMDAVFNEEYPRRGMVFAIGNQAKRPQTWQLLGVIRLDEAAQGELLV